MQIISPHLDQLIGISLSESQQSVF
jgi:hypothetical protein